MAAAVEVSAALGVSAEAIIVTAVSDAAAAGRRAMRRLEVRRQLQAAINVQVAFRVETDDLSAANTIATELSEQAADPESVSSSSKVAFELMLQQRLIHLCCASHCGRLQHWRPRWTGTRG